MSQSKIEKELQRSFAIENRAVDEDQRTVEIAFSSELPYERSFGDEVLDHEPQSVRLDRLNGGAAVLVNHDTGDQVGVVESARIDDDRMGRAVIRFSRSDRGREIMQDVNDGIRQLVSVGYRIHKYEVTEREGVNDLVRVSDWEPYELSIVSIPADASVGVGRSAASEETEIAKGVQDMNDQVKDADTEVQREAAPEPQFDASAQINKIRTQENKRRSDIEMLATEYRSEELGKQAISEGWTVEDFNKKAMEEVGERNNRAKAQAKSKSDGDVDLSPSDQKRFSLFRLMESLSNPNDRKSTERAAFEHEVCAEAARGYGPDFQPRGEFIPESALNGVRTLNAGTATDGQELVATNLLAGSFIDVLRNSMVSQQVGARMMPGLVGNVDIPRQTSGSVATWISAEDGDSSESEPQFDVVQLTPKDLSVHTMATRRLTQQSTPAVEGLIRSDIAQAVALGLDLAVFHGTGAAGQPVGIAGQSGINTTSFTAAGAPTFSELVAMETEVANDNAVTGPMAYVLRPDMRGYLKSTEKFATTGMTLWEPGNTVNGYMTAVSNQITANTVFFGNFREVLVGEWGGLELNVDPYTHSLKGRTMFIVFKTADVAVRHPESFCVSS